MFPVSVSGAVKLRKRENPGMLVAPIAVQLENLLEKAQASDWTVEGSEIRFTVALLRRGTGRGNILEPFESGRFEIVPQDDHVLVRYRMNMLRTLGIVTAMICVLVLFVWHGRSIAAAFGEIWPFALGGWLWLFGVGYLIAMIRVPLWLKRGLHDVR
jgi:hypothetical protein